MPFTKEDIEIYGSTKEKDNKMTFEYNGSGWYKMRNGEKAWIAGLDNTGDYLIGAVSNTYVDWKIDGTKPSHEGLTLIEEYKEPQTWWVVIVQDANDNIQSYHSVSRPALENADYVYGKILLAIHKITEGEGL